MKLKIILAILILSVIFLVGCQSKTCPEGINLIEENWESRGFSSAEIQNDQLVLFDKYDCKYDHEEERYFYTFKINQEQIKNIDYCNEIKFYSLGAGYWGKKFYCYNNEEFAFSLKLGPNTETKWDKIFNSILDNLNLKYTKKDIFEGRLVDKHTIKKVNCQEYQFDYTSPHGLGTAKKTRDCDNYIIHIGEKNNLAMYKTIEFIEKSPWFIK